MSYNKHQTNVPQTYFYLVHNISIYIFTGKITSFSLTHTLNLITLLVPLMFVLKTETLK